MNGSIKTSVKHGECSNCGMLLPICRKCDNIILESEDNIICHIGDYTHEHAECTKFP